MRERVRRVLLCVRSPVLSAGANHSESVYFLFMITVSPSVQH